ncbi:MAG: macro domain-containing protein [Chloroflexia bacterium]
MSVKYVAGDLFVNRVGAEALAHGCNCQGVMGAGVAVGFRERYPEMYEEYRRRCKAISRRFNVGDAFLWREPSKPAVFNLGTQENTRDQKATYDGVRTALVNMRGLAEKAKIDAIAMPLIGAGLGGLDWNRVRPIVEEVFGEWEGIVYVYETFVAGK